MAETWRERLYSRWAQLPPATPAAMEMVIAVLLLVAAGTLVRFGLSQPLGSGTAPYLFYVPGVIYASWRYGFFGGILMTILGSAAGFFIFLNPSLATALESKQLFTLGFFVLVCAAMSVFGDMVGWAQRRQRAASLETEQERERLRVTLLSIGDAVIVTDTKGAITFLNPSAEKLTGWSVADARARSLEEIFPLTHEVTGERLTNPITTVLRENRAVSLDARAVLTARDGRLLPIADTAAPIHGEQHDLLGAILVFHDVSDAREAENLLRASEERFRRVADSAPALIWGAGPDGGCNFFNQQWLNFTGRKLEQELGEGWTESVHSGDLTRCLQVYREAFTRREPFTMEYRLKRADGEYRMFLDNGRPVFETDGSLRGYLGTCLDVTDIHEAREQLRRSRDQAERQAEELEKAVGVRTEALAESVSELESFAHTVAHDFRAPLRAINGYAEILRADHASALKPEARELLERISKRAMHLELWTKDLLDYSRVSRAEIELRSIALDPIVAEAAAFATERGHARCTVAPNLGMVLASAPPLRLILSNLMENAVKFVPAGRQPEIKIWTEREVGVVILHIRDNGIGIAEGDRPKVFALFERGAAGRDYEGTGIGLALVKKAVERMGGSIHFTSEAGEGSMFCVRLKSGVPDTFPA